MKRFVMLVIFLLCINLVTAAEVNGNIYNLDLELEQDVQITIDSEPAQKIISKDGTYAIGLGLGAYTLEANKYENGMLVATAQEEIIIGDDGEYQIDLILFPALGEEEPTGIEVVGFEESSYSWLYYIIAIAFVIVLFITFKKRRRKPAEVNAEIEDVELSKVLNFIKKQGGRTTQKDIREEFPSSEAKISLMIAELEHKGLVVKIKKGRANVVILKR